MRAQLTQRKGRRGKDTVTEFQAARANLQDVLRAPTLPLAAIVLLCAAAALLPIPLTLVSDWATSGQVHHGNPALENHALFSRLLAVLVAFPFVEELCFRGLLLRSLRHRMGAMAAVVATTLLFAAAHGNALLVPYYVILGLVLSAAALRANSMWPAFFMHAAFNGGVAMIDASFTSSAAFHAWAERVGGLPAAVVGLIAVISAIATITMRTARPGQSFVPVFARQP